ncbi:hypothetical protein [Brevundimonas sp.]|uniref:hypothetical protein n=1 Tax=Brevundimonas sp. TaxID=1871086 RepID=UPI003D0A1912
MQLKILRSQKQGGIVSKNVLFCLDARVAFSADESANVRRYKLADQMIYSSAAAQAAAAGSLAAGQNARGRGIPTDVDDLMFSAASIMGNGLKAAALGALSKMKLSITIASLERGHHIECKSLDELLGAEEAIMDACRSLRGYLDTAATFDGREVLIDFTAELPTVVASSPAPQLLAPTSAAPALPRAQAERAAAARLVAPDTSSEALGFPATDEPPQGLDWGDRFDRAFAAVTPEQWASIGVCAIVGLIVLIVLVNLF